MQFDILMTFDTLHIEKSLLTWRLGDFDTYLHLTCVWWKDALLVSIREDYVDGAEILLRFEEENHVEVPSLLHIAEFFVSSFNSKKVLNMHLQF